MGNAVGHPASLSRVNFTACSATDAALGGGGLFVGSQAEVLMSDAYVHGCTATLGHGGGIMAQPELGNSLTMDRTTIDGCEAARLWPRDPMARRASDARLAFDQQRGTNGRCALISPEPTITMSRGSIAKIGSSASGAWLLRCVSMPGRPCLRMWTSSTIMHPRAPRRCMSCRPPL